LNEAAEWIFGAGRAGGGNFYKARAVVEALESSNQQMMVMTAEAA
jgi:hypothetical protein